MTKFDSYQYWISQDNKLKIEFWLEFESEAYYPYARYQICRLDQDKIFKRLQIEESNEIFKKIKGHIGYTEVNVKYEYLDGYKINGTFRLEDIQLSAQNNSIAVWTDLFFDENEFGHFEGAMVHFTSSSNAPIIDVEVIEPVIPEDESFDVVDDVSDTIISNQSEFDLFPYVQMQFWPKITHEELLYNFIQYPFQTNDIEDMVGKNLYQQLSTIKQMASANARESMLNTTLDFINNSETQDWADIPFPFTIFPKIYESFQDDTCFGIGIQNIILETLEIEFVFFEVLLNDQAYNDNLNEIWQNYFALTIIQGYEEQIFTNLNKTIIVANIVNLIFNSNSPSIIINQQQFQSLLNATIILPSQVFPLPSFVPSSPPIQTSVQGWVQPYALGFLQMIKQRLIGYALGEISRIENVAQGEKKKIIRRNLKREESTDSIEKRNDSSETQTLSDLSKNVNSEINKTIGEIVLNANFDNLNLTYGPLIISGSYTNTTSQNEPEQEAQSSFAKHVLSKTSNRIKESVLRLRASSVLNESEETVSSLFDNTKSNKTYRGVYRWLNKIYNARVVNYGNRLILEVIVKNPAANYKNQQQNLFGENVVKPIPPSQMGITDYTKITTSNFVELDAAYGIVDVILPPQETILVSSIITSSEDQMSIEIPEGYMAIKATISYVFTDPNAKSIEGIIGSVPFIINNPPLKGNQTITLKNETDSLPVIIGSSIELESPPNLVNDYIMSAEVECMISTNAFSKWQIQVYKNIVEAYEKQKESYNNDNGLGQDNHNEMNPAMIREIILSELKYNCENILIDIYYKKVGFPSEDNIDFDINSNDLLYIQLFNMIFEWNELSYTLSESYNSSQDIQKVFLQGTSDSLKPFLQASTANVLLPIKPEFNFIALYYLSTGLKWEGETRFTPILIDEISIASAIKNLPNKVNPNIIDSWDVTIPTSMQVIQNSDQVNIIEDEIYPEI